MVTYLKISWLVLKQYLKWLSTGLDRWFCKLLAFLCKEGRNQNLLGFLFKTLFFPLIWILHMKKGNLKKIRRAVIQLPGFVCYLPSTSHFIILWLWFSTCEIWKILPRNPFFLELLDWLEDMYSAHSKTYDSTISF